MHVVAVSRTAWHDLAVATLPSFLASGNRLLFTFVDGKNSISANHSFRQVFTMKLNGVTLRHLQNNGCYALIRGQNEEG
jgi:hypothetical protein